MSGTKKNIRPDLVLFVNGIPLVIIECKRFCYIQRKNRAARAARFIDS